MNKEQDKTSRILFEDGILQYQERAKHRLIHESPPMAQTFSHINHG